jgi:protein-S-isoprenylcysteine O-methyltransferase Ste14
VALARLYFAVQALAGAAWWVAVFTVPGVKAATLGELDALVVAAVDIPLFVLASAVAAIRPKPVMWVVLGWTLLVTAGMVLYATVTTLAGWGALTMLVASGGSVLAVVAAATGRIPTEWVIAGPFRFRVAREGAKHWARTFAQLTIFWGLFLVVLPAAIAVVEWRWQLGVDLPMPVRLAGIGILLLASALGVWSARTMAIAGEGTPLPSETARRLVVAGPYRVVRNPMAVAGVAQGVAIGLLLSSWLVVLYALAGSLIWNWVVRPHEEADLAARFGEEFERYRASVRCWLPSIRSPSIRA